MLAIVVGELVAIHGKAASSFLFAGGASFLREIPRPIWVYLILAISSVIYILLRLTKWNPSTKMLAGVFVGFIATIGMQLNDNSSSLILFLQLFVYATATGILWIESYFQLDLEKDFWKFMFENVFKSIRYILVVYGAMVVVLRYISSSNGEKTIGFITTLSYPTVIVLGVVFMIGYWVLLPSWERYVVASKVHNKRIQRTQKTRR
ncbi:hypothetical protein Flexsi_1779 [Flexistipes sinusarabici DSM 4947]|uniref:Uncharacterized protein n=1 Tax=Flexistipes sinusarabici (strain ATCC 49648 / DSM 4947 / MAS 10) TaxID=717231 RepID=F8EA07_FLESM|nr:hypothetical protein [Flexistipes sinusarabici]AEI15418.1 hypothetical protein Flexsi_1779 [Flexistipes sinusarabici DSM 4947]